MLFIPNAIAGNPYAKNSFYIETHREGKVLAGVKFIALTYSGNKKNLLLRIVSLVGLILLALATGGLVLFCSAQMQLRLSLVLRSFSKQTAYQKDIQLINNKAKDLPKIVDGVINRFLPLADLVAIAQVNRHLATLNTQLTQIKASAAGKSLMSLYHLRQVIELAPAFAVSADGRTKIFYNENEIEKRNHKLLENLQFMPLEYILQSYDISFRLIEDLGYYEKNCGVCLFTFLVHHVKARAPVIGKMIELLLRKGMPPELILKDKSGVIFSGGASSVGMACDYPDFRGVAPQGTKLQITPNEFQNNSWLYCDVEALCQQFKRQFLDRFSDERQFDFFVEAMTSAFYLED